MRGLFEFIAIVNVSSVVAGKYVVVHTESVRVPYMYNLKMCVTPGCMDGFIEEQREKWFDTQEDAMAWANRYVADERLVEIRACMPVRLTRHRTGTRDKIVMREERVQEDVYEWIVKEN